MNAPDYKLPGNYSGPKDAVPVGQTLVDVRTPKSREGGLINGLGYKFPDNYTGPKGAVPTFDLPPLENTPVSVPRKRTMQ